MRGVLISGGTGFVGRHLVRHLARNGVAVGCIVRDTAAAAALGERVAVLPHHGSTEELHDIVRRLAPQCVVHLASYFVAEHQPHDVAPLISANLLFATQLADAAAAAAVEHFVNTGTAWQHYEGEAYNPDFLYAATK